MIESTVDKVPTTVTVVRQLFRSGAAVAQLTVNQWVAGSNPASGAI